MKICIFNKYLGGHYTIIKLERVFDYAKRKKLYDIMCENDFLNMHGVLYYISRRNTK